MKTLIFLLISFIPFWSLSMTDSLNQKKPSYIICFFSNDYYPLKKNLSDINPIVIEKGLDKYRNNGGGNGFSFGVNYNIKISPRFYFTTGLNYTQRKIKYQNNVYDVPTNTYDIQGFKDQDWLISDEYALYAVQLPVLLQYSFLNLKRVTGYAMTGVKNNVFRREKLYGKTFLTQQEESFITNKAENYLFYDVNPVYDYQPFYLTLGVGGFYFFPKKFNIGAELSMDVLLDDLTSGMSSRILKRFKLEHII